MFDFLGESPLPSPVFRLIGSKGADTGRDEAPRGVEHNRLLFVRWLVEHRRLTDSPVLGGQHGEVAAAEQGGPGGTDR
jgi:hypothetical protein